MGLGQSHLGKQARQMAQLVWGTIALLFVQAVSDSNRVLPLNPGGVSNFQDPKYKLDFHEVDDPYVPEEPDMGMVTMTDGDGSKFQCFLPKRAEAGSKDVLVNDTGTSADTKLSRKTPEELLDILKDACVLLHEGWWTYELCYHGKLRQLHLDHTKTDKKEVQEFVLGVYDPEATARLHIDAPVLVQKDPRSQTAAQKYYAHMYTNGTICDLTNSPREAEVRFVCSETGTALISSVKESPTCKYTVVFQAPMLCKHPLFQEERQPWLVINCNRLPSDSYVATSEDVSQISEMQMRSHNHEMEMLPLPTSTSTAAAAAGDAEER